MIKSLNMVEQEFRPWQMEMGQPSQHFALYAHSIDEIQEVDRFMRTSKEEQACFSLMKVAQDHFVSLRQWLKAGNKYYCRRRRARKFLMLKKWRNKGNETK